MLIIEYVPISVIPISLNIFMV